MCFAVFFSCSSLFYFACDAAFLSQNEWLVDNDACAKQKMKISCTLFVLGCAFSLISTNEVEACNCMMPENW